MSYVYNFLAVLDEMKRLHEDKNSDYGGSIHDTYDHYGLTAYLVRMEDKINRLRSLTLTGGQRIEDEKIRDTLMDLANYAALAVCELDARAASETPVDRATWEQIEYGKR